MSTDRKKKVFFIDRDGVINKEIGYLHEIEKFTFIDGILDAFQFILNKNYEIIIITNQSGIGRGIYSEAKFFELNQWMLDFLSAKKIDILDVFYCPHSPEDLCYCRKPKPGMFLDAKEKFNIEMDISWAVGDKETDIQAANSAGISNTILVKSGHDIDENNSKASYILDSLYDVLSLNI